MEFHTLLFLFRWLPVVLLLYLLYFRTHAREAFLLVVSLLFYAWGEPLYVFLLIALGAAHYVLARRMSDERWRWLLLPAVIADVFLLVYFKYYGTILDQLSSFFSLSYEVMPMPSGISFFMFSLLSYLADVGRGKIEPERSLCRFLLYVSFFPKLLMGPIMRYADFRIQLERPYAQRDQMNKGVCLFIAGLAQKVILSAWMADLFARMGQLPLSFVSGWGQAVAYSLQLYLCRSISVILICLIPSRHSGGAGISRWVPGSGIMCISRWAAAAVGKSGWSSACLRSGCSRGCGMASRCRFCSGDCIMA